MSFAPFADNFLILDDDLDLVGVGFQLGSIHRLTFGGEGGELTRGLRSHAVAEAVLPEEPAVS